MPHLGAPPVIRIRSRMVRVLPKCVACLLLGTNHPARPLPASQWRKATMTLPVDYPDKRYRQLVDWLANEHKVLSQALRREPTDEEHRAHAHAFVDLVFDDQAK